MAPTKPVRRSQKSSKLNQVLVKRRPRLQLQSRTRVSDPNAVFGPVSAITTAPVSIGNTVVGASPVIRQTENGVRVQGRDFMFQAAPVAASSTDWILSGGCPLIPHAFVASVLRSYASIYAEFSVHGLTFHYITSSATNSIGDIMFYVNKNRGSALLDTTNPNFLSVVLSDPHTVMGPLWQNASAAYKPVPKYYSTDILNDEDLRTQGPGELFLYTKSATLSSPGYVLVDFDITFRDLQVNIRDLTFPMNRLKYNQYGFGFQNAVSLAQGAEAVMQTNGTLVSGLGGGSLLGDPQVQLGDVFKCVMCTQYAFFAAPLTRGNLLQTDLRQGTESSHGPIPTTIDDGFTFYGVFFNGTNGFVMLYPTLAAAMSQQFPYEWGTNATNVTWVIPCWISLVANVRAATYQANY